MTKQVLKEGLKQYAINTAFLVLKLPYYLVNKNDADQLNRAALRAKRAADFLNKLKIVEEALDETINLAFQPNIKEWYKEGNESLAIIVSSITRVRTRQKQSKS